jgi:DNA-binding response OmpR family regulator
MSGEAILVVDDDERICRLLRRYLAANGFEVDTATDGDQMRDAMRRRRPDLILMDLQLPGTSGLELVREQRAASNAGIIILTGSGGAVDRIVGLEIGADDYVQKPFDERELLARIRSVLRRRGPARADPVDDHEKARFAGWTLDFTAHQLTDEAGRETELTGQEYQFLEMLVRSPNRVFTRDQIMDRIAGRSWMPTDRSVDVLVGKLRRKIEPNPEKPVLIKTIRGSGYIMTTRVEFC